MERGRGGEGGEGGSEREAYTLKLVSRTTLYRVQCGYLEKMTP